ncbi:MAG: hypothetical protein A2Y62_01590 [Candidatus Fischerbacteria bacterium RBG_13_37_8]|uniref:Uncharacterized protein n=1 Tax=Candidatus Fischerbacteria bacterium RBG_13_37_8 TaxID=1817863 RepID=A0A1F5VU93_9BACT|nr:MAG: hypothetical protein A2Y62_01590 [Candidatus Fischerbacteria bacterium RBG_13_37_8]
MKKAVYAILFFILFIILLIFRCHWDSYRFYQKGILLESSDIRQSILYYGSSIRSGSVVSHYKEKSRERLKEIMQRVNDPVLRRMIADEIREEKAGRN